MYNNQISGKNDYYWFLGQVVDEVCWQGNQNHKIHTRDDVPGWGYRYKIRIFGRDTRTKDVPDDQLEMAEVILPVTAGSGHGGSIQTPNIRQGAFVTGFYKDGMDATEPVITGLWMNNSQTRLFGGDTDLGFTPRSGYLGKNGNKPVSTKNTLTEDEGYKFPPILETAEQIAAIYHYDQLKDGTRCVSVPKTRACDGANGEMKAIQRQIKNVINFVNDIKSKADSFLGQASDLTNAISSILNDATTFITTLMKTLMDKARGFVVNAFNKGVSKLISLVPPNLVPSVNAANEKGTDAIQCGFNAIIDKLFDIVKDLLDSMIEKYINAPMCAVENFIGSILGTILADVTGVVQGALDVVNGLIGQATKFVDDVFSVVDTVFGFLKFLTCAEDADCSMIEDWSLWYGAKCVTDEVPQDTKSNIKIIAENFSKTLSGITSSIGIATDTPPCGTGQLPCGPPSFVVDGIGMGSGALGNPIISGSGSILGIDLISGGDGYLFPNVQIVDNCGNGNGVVAIAELDETNDREENRRSKRRRKGRKIKRVVIIEPGVGFLPAPDGSTGANQSTYSGPDDTIYEDNNGNKRVYKCGKTISVFIGNKLYMPQATTAEVYDKDGNVVQTLNGLGQLTAIPITANGRVTLPCKPKTTVTNPFPNSSNGTYPVALGIGTVYITNPGIGYTSGDSITVTPDNGSSLEPVFSDGQLTGVNVIKPGIGFTEFPTIVVNSNTGFNANMVPVFDIIRVNENPDEVPFGTSLIEVIDCVGRVL